MFDYTRKVIASYFNLKPSERFRRKSQDMPRDYSDLPDMMMFFDGNKVNSTSDFERRKTEIVDFYAKNVYSPIPSSPYRLTFEIVESGKYNDILREQVKACIETDNGKSIANFLIYRPNIEKEVPVIVALNSGGNYKITSDKNVLVFDDTLSLKKIEKARGSIKYIDFERIVKADVAVITCETKDFAPDDKENYKNSLGKLFPENSDISAISLWALGNEIMVDYLESCDWCDKNKIAVFGHSRLGKTALWTAVNDKRIALAILNDSGCMGANLCRGSTGETTKLIMQTFPHWFSNNFQNYCQDPSTLPVDQHMLLGCISPRKLYVANGKDDLCADPQGSYNSLQFALPAFELYGLDTIPKTDTQPKLDTYVHSGSVGYHLRSGSHNVLPIDWDYYLEYINKYL